MPLALMGLSAVIPEPNMVTAVIYVAGLSDDSHTVVLRLEDSDQGSNWDIIGSYDHGFMFSALMPLKKVPYYAFQQLLLIGGIKPDKCNGKWQFSSSIIKIENQYEYSELAALQDEDGQDITDFFFDNQWVQPDETEQEFYILGKNIYIVSIIGDNITAVKQQPGYI